MIYFTSDNHYNHFNIIRYTNRPFKSIEEMNNVMIKNWNSIVTNKDIVYYLGDFGLSSKKVLKDIFDQLNKKKVILIKGNHDKCDTSMREIGFSEVHKYMDISFYGKKFFLSHVPFSSYYFDAMICGHVHNTFRINGNIFNVGVDVNNFYPISIEHIIDNLSDMSFKKIIPMEIEINDNKEE